VSPAERRAVRLDGGTSVTSVYELTPVVADAEAAVGPDSAASALSAKRVTRSDPVETATVVLSFLAPGKAVPERRLVRLGLPTRLDEPASPALRGHGLAIAAAAFAERLAGVDGGSAISIDDILRLTESSVSAAPSEAGQQFLAIVRRAKLAGW